MSTDPPLNPPADLRVNKQSIHITLHSFRTPKYEEGKEGHLEQKRPKEDTDARF